MTLNRLCAKHFVMFVFRNKFIPCITDTIFVVRPLRINLCQLMFWEERLLSLSEQFRLIHKILGKNIELPACMYGKLLRKASREKHPWGVPPSDWQWSVITAQQVNLAFSVVVESVLKKDEHRLEDKRLSRYYPLKVTRYCENVSSFIIYLVVLPLLC